MSKEHEQRIYDRCLLRVGQLEAENAKLRELVRGLYGFAYQEYPDKAEENFANELRELGIEVDEW